MKDLILYTTNNLLAIAVIATIIPGGLGHCLGRRKSVKQFNLEHFDLHEEVLNGLNSIFEDEIEGHLFSKTDKEIWEMPKNHNTILAKECFSGLKNYESSSEMLSGDPVFFGA